MSLLDLPIPPRPDYFGPDGAPPGVELRLDVYGSWAKGRPTIKPRVCITHTNAASVEASVQSSINYGNAASSNTKPHYHVGDRPAKVLRTDKRAIANSTEDWFEQQTGEVDCSFWSIAIETADMGSKAALAKGYRWPIDCGPFLTHNGIPDAEIVARINAYESIVWGFPLDAPPAWNASGACTHTAPYPHPHYTIQEGKTCPGSTKKSQFLADVLPRARQLVAAWTEEPKMRPDPRRLFDSRQWGGEFLPTNPDGSLREYTIPVGANVSMAEVKLSVVAPAENGWVAVWGSGPLPPNYSVMDFEAGKVRNGYPCTGVVNGVFKLYTSRPAHIVVDLMAVQD